MTDSQFKKSILLTLFFIPFVFVSSPQAGVLAGKVTSIHGDVIELDLGSEKGINPGDSGRVYYPIKVAEKQKPIHIAKFKITHLSEKSSMAQIEEKTGNVQVGNLVEVAVKSGELGVNSVPKGARVFLDGKEMGETPLEVT